MDVVHARKFNLRDEDYFSKLAICLRHEHALVCQRLAQTPDEICRQVPS